MPRRAGPGRPGSGGLARAALWGFLLLGLAGTVTWGVYAGLTRPWRGVPALAEFRGSLVFIDPGHGGRDPGAVGPGGVREKDVVLAVALHLEMLLHRAGVYTELSRRTDVDLADPDASVRKPQDLRRRAERANMAAADVFVSLHANSFPSAVWSGAQTFYFPGDEEGRRLAVEIQDALRRELGPSSRRPQPGNFRVLRDAAMPGVVVEVGFLSNPGEERALARPEYRQRVAKAIYEGIISYLKTRGG